MRGDCGVAAQLDILNAPMVGLEVALGLLDLLGLERGGSRLENDEALQHATREDLLRFAIDQATAHLLGFCSIRCWGNYRE